jgi:hypothetical protein
MDKAKEDVFSTDVIVIEHASFFLRQNNNAAGSVGKALKHQFISYSDLAKRTGSSV